VRGESFEEGEEYVQVTRDPTGNAQSNFLIERRDDLREIRMSCQLTGAYAHWWLTEAQGGTFVELEMGMEPRRLGHRVFDRTLGRRYFRSWGDQSLDALREAARRERCEEPEAARAKETLQGFNARVRRTLQIEKANTAEDCRRIRHVTSIR